MYNKTTYINYLKNLQRDNWRRCPLQQKEETLQYIVDYHAYQLGLPSICKVVICKMKDDSIKGTFNKTTDELKINKKIAIDGLRQPFCLGELDVLVGNTIFETLMHEFEHALQKHSIDIISKCGYDMNVFELNYNNGNNQTINSLFRTNRKDFGTSALLYHIQPVERDAFMYAKKSCEEFNCEMQKLFPNDLSYIRNYASIEFDNSVLRAKVLFNTETPFEDIDDIIRVLNGIEPHKEINQTMYDAVIKTQSKDFVQKIIDKFNYEEVAINEQQDIEIS